MIRQLARLRVWSVGPNGRRAAFHRTSTTARRHPERVRDDLTTVMDRLASGTVRPLVAEVLPLTRAGDAHELIERGRVRGKVILVP